MISRISHTCSHLYPDISCPRNNHAKTFRLRPTADLPRTVSMIPAPRASLILLDQIVILTTRSNLPRLACVRVPFDSVLLVCHHLHHRLERAWLVHALPLLVPTRHQVRRDHEIDIL